MTGTRPASVTYDADMKRLALALALSASGLSASAGAQSTPVSISEAAMVLQLDRARTSIVGYLPELVSPTLERALVRAGGSRGVTITLITGAGTRSRNDSLMNNLVLAGYDGKRGRVTAQEVTMTGASQQGFLVVDGRVMLMGNLGYVGPTVKQTTQAERINRAQNWVANIRSRKIDAVSVYFEMVSRFNRSSTAPLK